MRTLLIIATAMSLAACGQTEPDLRLCASAVGDPLEQVRACDALLVYYDEGSGGYGAVLTWCARAKERAGDVDGAKQDYEAALEINPDDGFALLGMGGILLDANELQRAETYLHRSIEVHGSGRAADMLGGYALQHGENELALKYYDDLLDRVPDHEVALYGRGIARLRLGDEGGRIDVENARAGYPNVDREFAERGIAAP